MNPLEHSEQQPIESQVVQLALQTTLVGEGVGETDELVVVGAAEDEDEVGGLGTERENNENTELLCSSSLYTNMWVWLDVIIIITSYETYIVFILPYKEALGLQLLFRELTGKQTWDRLIAITITQ